MLRSLIAVSNSRDVRPFNARSLALSALLGTHPPELPVRALIQLAELFGMSAGTMRTALSRMTATGEISSHDGRYRLGGAMLDRQRAQDAGRRSPTGRWDGSWHSLVTVPDQRSLAERRRLRAVMANHRFGELRPDIWLRPANLPAPADGDWIVITGPLGGAGSELLAGRLWDLRAIADTGRRLVGELADLRMTHDWTEPAAIPPIFTVSAAVVRFLRTEPLLPGELLPDGWPIDELRMTYDGVEADFQRLLSAFLRAGR